jgi:multisubunit Na+/H+ antiporter MnhB subunit
LSAVAVLAITFSLMFAGYQYMTARANAGQVTAAKNRIIMTIVALLLYIFMYAVLNWLIPGGIFPAG